MKPKNKALLLSLCAVMLVAASVFGTIAYLTDNDAVTNTFSVGAVGLNLDEAKVDEDGTPVNPAERTEEGNSYHLIPGHSYIKDPTVTLDDGSEDSYVRMMVKVENIDRLKQALPKEGTTAEYYGADGTFLVQKLCVDENGSMTWNPEVWKYNGYTESTDGKTGTKTGTYEFRYKTVVTKGTNELEPLFTHITVPGEIDNESLTHLEDVKIVVAAHAIQADGFDTAAAAWSAFPVN